MEQLLDQLLEWIRLHPHWAGLLVLVVSALESFLVVGLLVPGTVIMFAVGAMVAGGQMELLPTLIYAVIGAILGDGSSYLIGRHFHQRLRVIWPFRRYPAMMNQGVDFFHRHGGKSVLLARFVGPVRPLVPAVAGMLDMPAKRFFMVNTLSALVWAPAYMAPGILFGASLGLAAEIAGRLALLLALLVALLWFSWWLVRRLARSLQPLTKAFQYKALAWGRKYPLIEPLSGALLDPGHPEARGMTMLTGILIIASWSLLATTQQHSPETLLGNLNLYVFNELQNLRTPLADRVMVWITRSGQGIALYSFTLLVSAWLLWQRYWQAVVHWLAAVAGVGLLTQAIKQYTQVSRPIAELNTVMGYAFLSGHASVSMAVYGFLAVMVARELRSNWRWTAYSVAFFLVVSISFSRLYLGAHWLSDILGGWSLGLVWAAMMGIAYRGHPAPAIPLQRLLPVVAVAFGLMLLFSNARPLDRDLALYQKHSAERTLDKAQWLAEGWKELPAFRNDLRGHHHPLSIQWAGPPEQLKQRLTRQGWHQPAGLSAKRLFETFSSQASIDKLPVLPQIHNGKNQRLVMVRRAEDGEHLLVLRLWPTNFKLSNGDRLWVGNVSYLQRDTSNYLFTLLRTSPDFDTPLQQLRQENNGLVLAIQHVSPEGDTIYQWSGDILLLSGRDR